jgi:transcriptional regulator with XRE-family HTH domain
VSKSTHPLLRSLGTTIRLLRNERRLSQEALADLAGIERGLRNISVLHAIRIATALDVALPHLLPFGERVSKADELATVLEFERVVSERSDEGRDWELGQSLSLG